MFVYFKTKNLIQINSSGFGLIYINFGIHVRLECKSIQIKTIIMITAYPDLSPKCSLKSFSQHPSQCLEFARRGRKHNNKKAKL